ncbi:MAG: ABC transporter permease [Ignavibacteria bacterium]
MRTIIFILQKEFIQIFRNKAMLPIIFIMPLVQLLILSNAATYDVKNINFAVVDMDQSRFSRQLLGKIFYNGYFNCKGYFFNTNQAEDKLRLNEFKLIIVIPPDFEKNYLKQIPVKVQLIINSEDGAIATVILNYVSTIINDFSQEVAIESRFVKRSLLPEADIFYSFWYNPEMNYKIFMVPGILVILVSMIGLFLTGMNIAREKEIGTIEQINVTPIKKYQFIIGKLLPFWILGQVELSFGLLVAVFVFNISIVGNPLLIFVASSIYLLVLLGIGLFISTVTNTQQQAMFIAWFFMVVFMLIGGVFTPLESMPEWAQIIAFFNPVSHFNRTVRMIMTKGSGIQDIQQMLIILLIYAFVILSLAILQYRKVSK